MDVRDFCVICNIERIIMSFLNAFIGVPQSRYAAFAVLTAILVVSLTILFGNQAVPLSQKFAFIFMLFLVSLPGILLSLFQLTCIVVGAGVKNQRPWCSIYAWIISILLIVYCALLIVLAVVSLTNRSKAIGEVAIADAEKFVGSNKSVTMEEANKFATQMFANEKFEATAAVAKPTLLKQEAAPSTPAPTVSSAPQKVVDTTVPPMTVDGAKPAEVTTAPVGKFTNPQRFEGPKLNHAGGNGFATQHFAAPPTKKEGGFATQHFAANDTKKNGGFATQHFATQRFTNDRINGQSDVYGDMVEPFDGSAATYSVAPQKFGLKKSPY